MWRPQSAVDPKVVSLRDGPGHQNEWIFAKVPNGLWPPSFSENYIAIFFHKAPFKALYKGPKSAIWIFGLKVSPPPLFGTFPKTHPFRYPTVPNQSDPQRISGQQQSGCILPLQTLCGSFFHRTSSRQVSHVCRFWAWTFRMETTGSPLFNILTFFNAEEVPRDGGGGLNPPPPFWFFARPWNKLMGNIFIFTFPVYKHMSYNQSCSRPMVFSWTRWYQREAGLVCSQHLGGE